MNCTFPQTTGAAWAASHLASSAHAAVSDDALKDFDNAGWVRDLPASMQPAWVRRIRAVRLADRLAENQQLDPASRRFDDVAADPAHGPAKLHLVRDPADEALHVFDAEGPAVRSAWTRYLAALRAYHGSEVRLATLEEHSTMLDRLSGSLFQLLPFLAPEHVEAIRAFGVVDQFFNNLRDLAEDAAQGICYFPDDVLARAGLRREDVLRDGFCTKPGWHKLMRFWLDEYLPELEGAAARFEACQDLHPSVLRMRSECRARYQRILRCFRAARFDYQLFAEEYWREVRGSAESNEATRSERAA